MKMSIDDLTRFLREQFPEVADKFSIDGQSDEFLTIRMHVGKDDLRPGGTVSGPTMFSVADVGIYIAILGHIGPKALTVTTNASIDFMRKPKAGSDLIGKVRILKIGRSLAVGDALIYSDGSEDLVARASMTYSIPQK